MWFVTITMSMPEGPSKSAQYPGKILAGVAGAVILCLWGSFSFYEFESAYQQQNRDTFMVGAQVTRFAGLMNTVPENALIGYMTDAAAGSVVENAMFLSAQYTLAPRLLDHGTAREWVLGNFTRAADFAALGQAQGLQLQQDFGNGVVLYRKAR